MTQSVCLDAFKGSGLYGGGLYGGALPTYESTADSKYRLYGGNNDSYDGASFCTYF